MIGVILAAGVGRRIAELTGGMPKCLLKVGGRTILERQLDALERHGIRPCVVVGHRKEQVMDACAGREVVFVFNPRYAETHALTSMWCAREHLAGGFCQFFGDVCFEDRLFDALMSAEHEASLAWQAVGCGARDAKVRVENGRVTAVGMDLPPETASGICLMSRMGARAAAVFIEELDRAVSGGGGDRLFLVDSMQSVISRGLEIAAVDVSAYRAMEVDSREDYERAIKVFG
jgi:choline kinase